ncbi:MAG: M1 family metallopeptidase, partial [Planctomycetota bacterium]|nr:M1 family metallopeptidase [Planctomycetota bacterium]
MAALFLLAGTDHLALDAEMPKQSARVVTYTIHAKLVPESQTVLGKMEIVWRNTSSTPVGELYFHLYLNAFRDRESTFMKEGQGRGRSRSNWDEDHPGSVEIGSMKTSDGRELWNDESRAFVAPDDGNDKDRTLARVTLPSPVAPDETVHLAVEFTSELPRVFRRTGWSGDPDKPDSLFFMLAQWYPKLAVLRSREGKPAEWNRHQYHANTEFFAEYGVFQVHITVPEGFVVGATGVRTNSVSNGDGTVTHVHKQEDVHDFAWCASPGFISREYEWEFDTFCNDADNAGVAFGDGPTMGQKIRKVLADTAARLGKELDDVKPEGKVTIKILVQRDHADLIDRFQWAAGASIACYGIWFGAYPYKVLTVMAPPNGGGAAGGMEYPTLITVWGNRLAPWYSTGMEGVTIHEFGHQYFYGLLGSNEFEEAWLDEGFTSFSDARCFEVAYGPNRTWLNYGNFTTPHTRPFDPPAVFPRFKRLLRLDSWLGQIPAPWKEPKTIVPDPGGSPFFDYV